MTSTCNKTRACVLGAALLATLVSGCAVVDASLTKMVARQVYGIPPVESHSIRFIMNNGKKVLKHGEVEKLCRVQELEVITDERTYTEPTYYHQGVGTCSGVPIEWKKEMPKHFSFSYRTEHGGRVGQFVDLRGLDSRLWENGGRLHVQLSPTEAVVVASRNKICQYVYGGTGAPVWCPDIGKEIFRLPLHPVSPK